MITDNIVINLSVALSRSDKTMGFDTYVDIIDNRGGPK